MKYALDFWIKFWTRTRLMENGCLEWTGPVNEDGYGRIRAGDGYSRKVMCHRIAWEMLHGEIPEGMKVLHDCDNPPCLCHLHLGTVADNNREKVERGRSVLPVVRTGEKCNFAKLTEEQVLQIRRLKGTISQSRIGAIFGVRQNTVSVIQSGKNWANSHGNR